VSTRGSLADLLGAAVRVGTVRVGEVVGVLLDRDGLRAIGLEVSSAGGTKRFVPWFAARRDGRVVAVESALVIVDDGGSYERLGARPLRDPTVLRAMQALPDGEIVTRGPNVMCGYFNKPEATAEAIDEEGWFHTGDIGMLDADGYLSITDRKKDLIVTASGKNIAPQPIENLAKSSKFVATAVMIGDRRPFPVMLVVPNATQVKGWADHKGLPEGDLEHLLSLPEVRQKIEREVRMTLRDLAQFEMPKKLLLLPRDFTVESGELTPTLKVRRRVVEERHRAAIEALYLES